MSFNQDEWSLKKYFCPICIGEQIGYAIEHKLFQQSEAEGELDIFDHFYGDKNPLNLSEFQKLYTRQLIDLRQIPITIIFALRHLYALHVIE